jgi:predicted lipid-binding transport protein (Tim44 family)
MPPRRPDQDPRSRSRSEAVARPAAEPLSDAALVALLGGLYVGGLGGFLGLAYVLTWAF